MEHRPIIAIFPGSFDPITNGHLDVICRGNKLFDHLVIAVGQNPGKTEFFTKDQRVEMIRDNKGDLDRVRCELDRTRRHMMFQDGIVETLQIAIKIIEGKIT